MPKTFDDFFKEYELSKRIFQEIWLFVDSIGPVEYKVSKSQISLRRRKLFARIWIPGMYLHGTPAPLVLTLSFHFKHPSPRWKEIIEPYAGRFTHHLELFSPNDVDAEVQVWLRDAWNSAG